jgi:hypothetical protein
MCFMCALALAGCEADDANRAPMSETPGQLLSDMEQSMSGEIRTVDPDAKIVVLLSDGKAETFKYTDATEVTGAAGPQGLAGREGAHATVHYHDERDGRMARRIVLE